MKRYGLLLMVLVLLGAALFGTIHYRSDKAAHSVEDEILAYEVSPEWSMTTQVPAGVDVALLTLWGLVDGAQRPAPEARFDYRIKVLQESAGGRARSERIYAIRSRFATETDPEGGTRGPHLADEQAWVTDARTLELDLRELAGHGGRLTLRTASATQDTVLVRLSYRFSRYDAERRLREVALSADEAERVVNQVSALGFADLPASARTLVLSAWGRRLTAVGRTGVDYHVRRLLLGVGAPLEAVADESVEFRVHEGLSAAFNLRGQADIRLTTEPLATLQIRDPIIGPRDLQADQEGRILYALGPGPLRTIVVASASARTVRASLPEHQASVQVGDVEHCALPSGRVALMPDVRRHAYFRLHPSQPLRFTLAKQQGPVRLRVRGIVPEEEAPHTRSNAALWAEIVDERGQVRRAPLTLLLEKSEFDRFEGLSGATEPVFSHLFLPESDRELRLFGPSHLALSVLVTEPAVHESVPTEPYQVQLAPDEVWRNVPYLQTHWTSIRPDNDLALDDTRRLILQAQVRLEREAEVAKAALPERALYPDGQPPRRTLLVEKPLERSAAMSEYWFSVPLKSRVRVPDAGGDARLLKLRFEVPEASLGQLLRVSVDGVERLARTSRTTRETVTLALTAGPHTVEVSGLGPTARLYSSAPQEGVTSGWKRYSVYALTRQTPLFFSVPRGSHNPQRLLLFFASAAPGRPIRVAYAIDAGRPARAEAEFVEDASEVEGVLSALSGEGEVGRLLEADGLALDANARGATAQLARASIRMGSDLVTRPHRVRVTLQEGDDRVWVRAVLVGQAAPSSAASPRAYVAGGVP